MYNMTPQVYSHLAFRESDRLV